MTDRRAQGWYRDPDDPTQLRHWGGRSWSGRRRSWPAWDITGIDLVVEAGAGGPEGAPVLDGPVRPFPLPAAARGGTVLDRDGAARLQRVSRPGTPRRSDISGNRPVGAHGAGPLSPGWMPSRRPLVVFCALFAVAVLMMAVTVVGVGRTPTQANAAVRRNITFLTLAASTCIADLKALRAATTPSMHPVDATAGAAVSAVAAADAVSVAATHLRSIEMAPDAAPVISDWLDTWSRYADDQRQLAAALSAPAPATSPPVTVAGPAAGSLQQLAARVGSDTTQADSFAVANGLLACTLSPSPALPGGLISIP